MRKDFRSIRMIAIGSAIGIFSFAPIAITAPALPVTTPAVIDSPSSTANPLTPTNGPMNVLVMPFRCIGENDKDAWISVAIQEQMTSDLTRNPAVHLLRTPSTLPAADILTLARQQHADRLVTGSYQTIDDQIRVNGDVIDPSDGKTISQLKVTGAKRDLFQLEDSLAAELQHALPGGDQLDRGYTVTPVPSTGLNQAPDSVAQADSGAGYPPTQVFNNYYYDGGSGYGGYGDYGYPYFGSPFFLYLGGDRFHHFRGGDGFGGGHDRQVGGGPIVPSPVVWGPGILGSRSPVVAAPARGSGPVRGGGPVGIGVTNGGLHGGMAGGATGGGGAAGHR